MNRLELKGQADTMIAGVEAAGNTWDALSVLWKWMRDQVALPGICDHKEWILEMCDEAIDLAVEFDVPQVPNIIERYLDQVLATWAKAKAKQIMAKACPDQTTGLAT